MVSLVDHKNFNLDVPFMKGVIPTSENIIMAFWKILEPAVAPRSPDQRLVLFGETGKQLWRIFRRLKISRDLVRNSCELIGEDPDREGL